MKILLDTCVLTELHRPQGNPAVKAAVPRLADGDAFLSVLTVGEVAKGVALLPDSRKKRELARWLEGLVASFFDRILPVDQDSATLWGEVTARAQSRGIAAPAVDELIAATVLRHGLRLMTRNTRYVAATGVLILDP